MVGLFYIKAKVKFAHGIIPQKTQIEASNGRKFIEAFTKTGHGIPY
jgi:hypothetical protein